MVCTFDHANLFLSVFVGPTSFAPIIDAAIDIVEESNGQYHVLVIIADGQVVEWLFIYCFPLIGPLVLIFYFGCDFIMALHSLHMLGY